MSKPTLPANSPDVKQVRREAAADFEAAATRIVTGCERLGEDGPFVEEAAEYAANLKRIAGRLRDY